MSNLAGCHSDRVQKESPRSLSYRLQPNFSRFFNHFDTHLPFLFKQTL